LNHDAISVQMCRDAGLDDATTDALLTRIASRLVTRRQLEAEARRTIEAFERLGARPGPFGLSGDRKAAEDALLALKEALTPQERP